MLHCPADALRILPLTSVFNAINGPLWVKAPDGVYLLVNKAFLHEFSVSSAAILGRYDKDIAWRRRVKPIFTHDAWVANTCKKYHSVESIPTLGEQRLWAITVTPLFLPNKGLAGTVGIAFDVATMCHDLQVYTEIAAVPQSKLHLRTVQQLPTWTTPYWSSDIMDHIKTAYRMRNTRPCDIVVDVIDFSSWQNDHDS